MVSALYVVLGALFLIKFSFDVIRLRRLYHVSTGDGGFFELQTAIRIHGNAAEYIPVAMLMMVMMEMNGAEIWMLHLVGIVFFLGRSLHFYGMNSSTLLWRKNGMILTIISLVVMILLNLVYLPWDLVMPLR